MVCTTPLFDMAFALVVEMQRCTCGKSNVDRHRYVNEISMAIQGIHTGCVSVKRLTTKKSPYLAKVAHKLCDELCCVVVRHPQVRRKRRGSLAICDTICYLLCLLSSDCCEE